MKKYGYIITCVTAMALGSALAGTVSVIGGADPSTVLSGLEGTDAGTSKQREVINRASDNKTIIIGQSFTLDAAQVSGGGFQLGEIFLRSANNKHFSSFAGDLEINLYQGEGATAVLLDTYEFNMASFDDGDTNAFDVAIGDWVRFSLDGGTNLTVATNYSFVAFWDTTSSDVANTWSFYRGDTSGYTDGVQYEEISDLSWTNNWPNSAWTGMAIAAADRDFSFYVGEALVGNQAPVANADSATIYGVDTALTLTGSDLDGDALTFLIEDLPVNGTLVATNLPQVIYQPDSPTFEGSDNFTFTVTDGVSTSAAATVSLSLLSIETPVVLDVGTSTPSAGSIASHLAAGGDEGNREVRWDSAANHSLGGQSFIATTNGTAQSITLKVRSTEVFANWTANSFQIQVFEGVGAGSTSLGSYDYDATALGSWNNHWVKFGLGSGIPMTNGVTYTYLIVCGEEDADHRINFARDSSSTEYPDGNEMRGANAYDVANFDTDPWDVATPIGAAVNTAQVGDMLFSIDGDIGPQLSALEQWIKDYGLSNNLLLDLPDGDGINNLLEYALGGNPNNDDAAAILPTSEVDGAWLNYVYRRQNPADPALSYAVLSSTDLVNGPITNATSEAGASPVVDGFETVTNRISTTTEATQFMNLKVGFGNP
ncbi:Ig-like domain-containing protein [Pontiella sulfatireligans]|uniref:Uncharacterized protein n=1 Tax=Pontiella sulfatireligans TaxID=2750658 RepID=A0A6C2UGM7_9BACT|nr:Ig-like domain-containing protein [Pontiella sulfatireligans]VGO18667.1 hypothetical protein SCARR_00720 [Pontiella sulfatireligans]